MISTVIISRYASALVDIVLGPKGIDPNVALENLRGFGELVASNHNLQAIMASPAVPAARKRQVIKRFSEMLGIQPIIRNFLMVLSDHHRGAALSSVIDRFELLLDERMGLLRAEVKSAMELPEDQKRSLEAELVKLAGQKVRMRFSIDPELIGGAMAQIGSTVYDGSVLGQFNVLRSRLA